MNKLYKEAAKQNVDLMTPFFHSKWKLGKDSSTISPSHAGWGKQMSSGFPVFHQQAFFWECSR